MGRIRDIDRQSALCSAKGVAVENAALVSLADNVHNSVEVHLRAIGRSGLDTHEVVELHARAFLDTDPELEWCRIHRAEHKTDAADAPALGLLSHGPPPWR